MVGRDLDALFPKTRHDARRRRCSRSSDLASDGVFTDISFTVRSRRDRRAGRPGRRRPQRGRPGHLRHRPARRRHGAGRRPRRCRTAPRWRRWRAGVGVGPGGPPPAGPGHGAWASTRTWRSRRCAGCSRFGLIRRVRRARAGRRLGRAPAAEVRPARDTGVDAVRRQPAEGRARPSGWRAGRQLLIIDEPTRGIDVGTKAEVHRLLDGLVAAGRGGADDLLRAAGGARHGRPRPRAARGPARRRAVPRGGRRGRRSCARPPARRGRPHDHDSTAATSTRQRRLLERACSAPGNSASSLVIVIVFGHHHDQQPRVRRRRTASQQLLAGAALIALLGVGETMVIVTRNVDLSVGSVLGPVGVHRRRPVQAPPAHAGHRRRSRSASGSARSVGAINGLITTVLRVPSLVVTLAVLYIIRGVDALIVNGKQIDPTSDPGRRSSGRLRRHLRRAVAGDHRGGHRRRSSRYAMRSFRCSRDLYAIGSNPEAAALAGVPDRAPGVHRVPDQRRARRAWPGRCSSPSSRPSTPPAAPATS